MSLLFIYAHPDDESFSGAGTAMKYVERGHRVGLVTATLGERGKRGEPPVCAPEELAACRERELREAAAIIGFDELHLLNRPDRGLGEAHPGEMRHALVTIIRNFRPSVVLTFDPNGFNVHPDHVAISRFAADAVAAAADPRWHPGDGEAHAVTRLLWTAPIGPWEAARRGTVDDHPGADFALDVSDWRARKAAALRAHRSQHLSTAKYFFDQPDPDRVLGVEVWRQAWGPKLQRRPEVEIL